VGGIYNKSALFGPKLYLIHTGSVSLNITCMFSQIVCIYDLKYFIDNDVVALVVAPVHTPLGHSLTLLFSLR
jgi:hypothetical protein